MDGSLLLLRELRKSFKLHSRPHLGSWHSTHAEQTPRLPVDPLAFKAEVEGSCVRSYVGSPRDDVRGDMLREPTSSIFIHPWVLLVQCIRAQDASFYESESSSSQTKPSPSQVASSRSPALLWASLLGRCIAILWASLVGREILSLALMVLSLSPVMIKTPPPVDLGSDLARGDSALTKMTQVEWGDNSEIALLGLSGLRIYRIVWLPLQGSPLTLSIACEIQLGLRSVHLQKCGWLY